MFAATKISKKSSNIIIIGGGPSGLSVFIKLIQNAIKDGDTDLTIQIIDKTSIIGPGLAYDTTQHHTLKVNDPITGMFLDIDNTKNFLNWLQNNTKNLKKRHHDNPELLKIIDNIFAGRDRFPPRKLFGEYCRDTLEHYVKEAQTHSIKVHLQTNTEITDMEPTKEGAWNLTTKCQNQFLADQVIIATGHMPSDRLKHFLPYPNFHPTPYLHSKIHSNPNRMEIKLTAPVAILASGLSAIDAAKLLNAKGHTGLVYMLSPSGQLPRLKGPPTQQSYQLKYLTREVLGKVDILSLEEIKRLLTLEIRAATNNPSLIWEKIEAIAKRKGKNPIETLNKEIKQVSNGQSRPWQLAINETFFESLPIIWERLLEKDRDEFLKELFPIYQKWIAGIPLENAEEISAMISKGTLKILKINDLEKAIQREPETGCYKITTTDGASITVSDLIDATGTGHSLRHSHLLFSAVQKQHAAVSRFGGLMTSPHDYRLMMPSGRLYQNVHAIGPVQFGGSHITEYSVEKIAMEAKIISENIRKSYSVQLKAKL